MNRPIKSCAARLKINHPIKTLIIRLLLDATLLFGILNLAFAENPANLQLRLFAGVSISGTVGDVYAVQATRNLAQTNSWSTIAYVQLTVTNFLFVDRSGSATGSRFYRAVLQSPPTNMVFIPPSTFRIGSPTNEVNRSSDESPQTSVTISRGFWMNKFEVTQREYLSVVGSNPSQFTGDLNRPVESVSWLDATNYCALLTQRDLAAGRIPPGTAYRLPTEAEWEYAARAGTSTRFNFGDDPDNTLLASNAWFAGSAGFGTHPVGQKPPNPWGLFDMAGNVLEWCSDWYGPYAGGFAVDPQGPDFNPIGVKVMRGGGWDSFAEDCRSARRQTEAVSPFIKDFILGFRVVLAVGQ